MILSIVSTLFNSADYIEELCLRISKVADRITENYEIILVNDCSPDNSLGKSLELLPRFKNLKIIDLAKHAGEHEAIVVGLAAAQGDYVFLVESDLEEEPEWLSLFWERLHADDVDVVYGVQQRRRGNLTERWTGDLYYRLLNFISPTHIPVNSTMSRLMTRRYCDEILAIRSGPINLDVLFASPRFSQKHLFVSKRSSSPTNYSFCAKLTMAMTTIFSLSTPRSLLLAVAIGVAPLLVIAIMVAAFETIWNVQEAIVFGRVIVLGHLIVGALILLDLAAIATIAIFFLRSIRYRPTPLRKIYTIDYLKGR